MNKIQYIELLKLRGITELEKGETVGMAIRKTGGEATEAEMVLVNENAMKHFIDKLNESEKTCTELRKQIITLENEVIVLGEDVRFLNALEAAGVDNWEGYGTAQEILEEWDAEEEE